MQCWCLRGAGQTRRSHEHTSLAFVFSILSAVVPFPLWIAVMLLALAHLVGERTFTRARI
jgi:hypothetical protein